MTSPDFYYMLSCILAGALSIILSVLIVFPHPGEFIRAERLGMGVMGGATLMALPRLYTQAPTPFDGWVTTLFWVGAFIFFAARSYRALRHWWANHLQARMKW